MSSSFIREILEGIDGLKVDEPAKKELRQLICDLGRGHGYKSIDRYERERFARRLLDSGVSRTTIADRLAAFYDISKKHAYRVIHAALQLSQKSPRNVTQKNQNLDDRD